MIDKVLNIDPYIAVGIFLFSCGFLILILIARAMILANASRNWDKTKGVILQSELYISNTGDSDEYRPQIVYNYRTNENDYESNRVYFGSNILSSFKKRRSLRVLNKYPKGKIVDVYFDRMNEKLSVLEPGIKSEIVIGFILSIVLLTLGYIFYIRPEDISRFFSN